MDGCISPMKLAACPPLFDVLSAMACLEAAPWPSLLPHRHHWPPLQRGVLTSFDLGFVIAADSQEDDYYVHEGP